MKLVPQARWPGASCRGRGRGLCRDLLGLASNPIPIKAALAMLGRDSGEVRLPLVALEPAQADKLRGVLRAYGLPLS